ncbi:hypothetical protein SAMN02744775_04161 [Enterobacter sp. CC120223-11]|nr:hypothetical protein SAMN02744775_04161 [Enterobacter sp. CC120223-11]
MISIRNTVLGLLMAGASLVCQAAPGQPVYQGYGVRFTIENGYFVYLNEKPCALDEKTNKAAVYSSGLYQVIVYKSGKVSLMKQGVYVGDLRRS